MSFTHLVILSIVCLIMFVFWSLVKSAKSADESMYEMLFTTERDKLIKHIIDEEPVHVLYNKDDQKFIKDAEYCFIVNVANPEKCQIYINDETSGRIVLYSNIDNFFEDWRFAE